MANAADADSPTLPTLPKVEDVDLGGDVTLVVGQEPNQARIKVLKALLAFVSKYFATLFSNTFREGEVAAAGKELFLKDDDPRSFITLCKILHMELDPTEKGMAPHELLGLAVVADKYGCVKALGLSLKTIFPEKPTVPVTFQEAGQLVCAAYLLNHAALFYNYTQHMMAGYTEPFTSLAVSDTGLLLPMFTWLTLESFRAKFRGTLIEMLSTSMTLGCPNPASCSRAKTYRNVHAQNATQIGLAPLRASTETISSLITKASQLKLGIIDSGYGYCNPECPTYRINPAYFTDLVQKMKSECKGLCLDCARREGKGKEEGNSECRVAHD